MPPRSACCSVRLHGVLPRGQSSLGSLGLCKAGLCMPGWKPRAGNCCAVRRHRWKSRESCGDGWRGPEGALQSLRESRSPWHGAVLCPTSDVAPRAGAWIQRTIKPLSPCGCLSPIQLGITQCQLFGCCLINSSGRVAVPELAPAWSVQLCAVRGPRPRPQPRDVPLTSHTERGRSCRARQGTGWASAELLPRSQHNSGDFNRLH